MKAKTYIPGETKDQRKARKRLEKVPVVEIVKPGGTGSPILPISERFAPFPPKKFFGFLIFLESFDLKFKIKLFTI